MNSRLLQIRYAVSGRLRKAWRYAEYAATPSRWARERRPDLLPFEIMEHRLPLVRKLSGVDPLLFLNKRTNLALAIARMSGVVVAPKKTMSFWNLIGSPTASRGYREGLSLFRGEPSQSVGGGLCQLANALYWLALHSELEVTERHHHSVDLFPDDSRRVPFGTGATVVHNFKDLRLHNPTDLFFQFALHLTQEELVASLRSSREPQNHYRVVERDHRFVDRPDGLYRQNAIVRERWKNDIKEGESVLYRNHSKCRYSRNEVNPMEAPP